MSDQSATGFGKELFADFEQDAFFAPAFKPLTWTEEVRTGSISTGFTTTTINHSGNAVEQGAGNKKQMVKDIDGITMTDIYVKASFADFAEMPALDQSVTYDGEPAMVVYVQPDPVKATFDLFIRR